MEILVDDADRHILERYDWRVVSAAPRKRYARARIAGKNVYLHRLLMGCTPGDGSVVDHINRDTLDNRRSNLRVTDHRGNALNRRIGKGGVWRAGKKWAARIRSRGRAYYLGTFDTERKARAVYLRVKRRIHPEFVQGAH